MNKGERVAGKQFHEKKEKEAQEKKDKADAETWWVQNSEKIVRMDVGKCYEYLKQSGERQVVYGMLYERLRQFKGPPPQPPQKQPMKPLHPPQQPCHRTPCTCLPQCKQTPPLRPRTPVPYYGVYRTDTDGRVKFQKFVVLKLMDS